MLLQLQRYPSIKVTWRKGSQQVTADLLSRDAYFERPRYQQPPDHLFAISEEPLDCPFQDQLLSEIKEATKGDKELQELSTLICSRAVHRASNSASRYRHFLDELTIDQGILYKGTRIIVPKTMQPKMLQLLHISHHGINATLRRARHTVFWLGMTEDITQKVKTCPQCQVDAPRQQRETINNHTIPKTPWTKLGADLFEHQHSHYLIIVDYTTDYFEYELLSNQSANETIEKLKRCFGRLGIPQQLHSDNGPQFTAHQFSEFSRTWGFTHTTSSPHYPQSNGKVESSVKIAKRILRRCSDPDLALLEYRNTPVEGMTVSPVMQLFGRHTRSILPQLTSPSMSAETCWKAKMNKKRRAQKHYNQGAKNLEKLQVGQPVLVRDWQGGRRQWRQSIIEKQLSDRSYAVRNEDDILRRNRRDIRPLLCPNENNADLTNVENMAERNVAPMQPLNLNNTPVADNPDTNPIRHSSRHRKPPSWLNDYVTY